MADITQLRYAQLIKRAFGLKVDDPGRHTTGSIAPSFDVQDPYQPENRAGRGERSFGFAVTSTNTSAASFGMPSLINPVLSGRLVVVRRATWSFNQPTSANQPGVTFIGINSPSATATVPSITSFLKDSRFQAFGGAKTAVAWFTGSVGTVGTFANNATYYVQIFPGAAAVPFIHQVTDLDLVLSPGNGINFLLASDTLPAATYTWNVHVEGFERIIDPNELTTPP